MCTDLWQSFVRMVCWRNDRNEKVSGEYFSEDYLESNAIYRKLCEAAICYDTFLFRCSAENGV